MWFDLIRVSCLVHSFHFSLFELHFSRKQLVQNFYSHFSVLMAHVERVPVAVAEVTVWAPKCHHSTVSNLKPTPLCHELNILGI